MAEEKYNAARRIRNILTVARSSDVNARTLVAWGSAFQSLDLPNPQFETFRLLGLLTEQVDELSHEVEGLGLDQSDYAVTFSNLTQLLMVTNLDAPWGSTREYITEEVLRQLGFFAQMSSIDETQVPAEDFGQLKGELLTFQNEVLESDIDDRLKAFVLKQVETILRAIREYPIRGAEAIADGDATLLANAIVERELLQEHGDKVVVKKSFGFWGRLRELLPWANFGFNLTRMLASGDAQKALEAGGDIVDKL